MISKVIKALQNPMLITRIFFRLPHKLAEEYYVRVDSLSLKNSEKVLFADLGANLGQGYSWFSKHFNSANIYFELFEPNPNCYEHLMQIPTVRSGSVKVHNVGVGATSGKFKFYGLAEDEGGKVSQGGSIVRDHNSWYSASVKESMDVEIIRFSEYLIEKSKSYKKIIVKMDIEGAEVELLEAMIADKSIDLIDLLYVEFHSPFQEKGMSKITRKREDEIVRQLKLNDKVKLRIWH